MGKIGAELIPRGGRVLTHCNAGSLAVSGWNGIGADLRSARWKPRPRVCR